MILDLEKPYSKDWKKGYLVINPEGRRTIILFNSKKDRSSVSYARYLLSKHLGRYLLPNEHVDHIDNDKTNDDINNLQILTIAENNRKTHCKPLVILSCPVCKHSFEKTLTQLRGRKHKIKNNQICCSRKCSGIFSHNK